MRSFSLDILIPARDEEQALPVLLNEIDRQFVRYIIVVDNGSQDRTAEVARAAGCQVVSCPQAGYGRACLAGIAHIAQDPPEVLLFLDGDRSDHPHHIPDLVTPIQNNQYDFVLGSRTMGCAEKGSLNLAQRFGNGLATRLMRWLFAAAYTDLGPFRAIRWTSLSALAMQDQDFGWTIEMQIKAHLHRLRTLEVPVDYRNRIGVSKISGTLNGIFRAGSKIIFTIFKYRWLTWTQPSGTKDKPEVLP